MFQISALVPPQQISQCKEASYVISFVWMVFSWFIISFSALDWQGIPMCGEPVGSSYSHKLKTALILMHFMNNFSLWNEKTSLSVNLVSFLQCKDVFLTSTKKKKKKRKKEKRKKNLPSVKKSTSHLCFRIAQYCDFLQSKWNAQCPLKPSWPVICDQEKVVHLLRVLVLARYGSKHA